MTKDHQTRALHMQLEFQQPADVVWENFVHADKVTHWFPPKAEVKPGKGGSIIWEWDDLGKFDLEIDTWEVGKHLRLLDKKQDSTGKPVIQTLDISFRDRPGGSQLQLVHSGFGLESEWDDEFAGICAGWTFELRILRHYLDHHLGKERHMVLWTVESPFDAAETRALILGPKAFLKEGDIESKGEGDAYTMRSILGDVLDGTVLVNHKPGSFAGAVPGLDQGIFRYEREGNAAFIALEMWGDYAAQTQAFMEKWKPELESLVKR